MKLGTAISYDKPTEKKEFEVSVLVFADASRKQDDGQLAYVCGLLIRCFQRGSTFHTVSWSSRKSDKPVKSIGAAKIPAASDAIDEGNVMKKAFEVLLNINVRLILAVDSKNLYESLSTTHQSSDRSIRAEFSVIGYEFETHNIDQISWIPGKVNLADAVTKQDRCLFQALQLSMFTSKICISLENPHTRFSKQSTG